MMSPTLESAELPADAIEVGRISEAWGIKGWFKVLPHSASPEALFFFQAVVSAATREVQNARGRTRLPLHRKRLAQSP